MRVCGTKGRLSPAFYCFSKPCSSADKTATKSCQIPSCFQNTCTKVAAADGLAKAEALSLLRDTHHTPGLSQTCPQPLSPPKAWPGTFSSPARLTTLCSKHRTAPRGNSDNARGDRGSSVKSRHLEVTEGSKGDSLSPKKKWWKALIQGKKSTKEKKS